MKIVYIRHGKKLYANNRNKDYYRWLRKHDAPMSKDGVIQVKHLGNELKRMIEEGKIEKPDLVLVSPYQRAIDTWTMMNDNLKLNVECKVDVYLSEYLGNQKFTDRTLHTEKYNPPTHHETVEMLEERCKLHVEDLELYRARGVKNIWVISHGFTISKILECILRIENPDFYLKEGEMMEVTI